MNNNYIILLVFPIILYFLLINFNPFYYSNILGKIIILILVIILTSFNIYFAIVLLFIIIFLNKTYNFVKIIENNENNKNINKDLSKELDKNNINLEKKDCINENTKSCETTNNFKLKNNDELLTIEENLRPKGTTLYLDNIFNQKLN